MQGNDSKPRGWRGDEVGSDPGGGAEAAASRAEGNSPVRADAEQKRSDATEDIRQQTDPSATRDALGAGGSRSAGAGDNLRSAPKSQHGQDIPGSQGNQDGADNEDSEQNVEQKFAAAREDHAANPHAGRVPRGRL